MVGINTPNYPTQISFSKIYRTKTLTLVNVNLNFFNKSKQFINPKIPSRFQLANRVIVKTRSWTCVHGQLTRCFVLPGHLDKCTTWPLLPQSRGNVRTGTLTNGPPVGMRSNGWGAFEHSNTIEGDHLDCRAGNDWNDECLGLRGY